MNHKNKAGWEIKKEATIEEFQIFKIKKSLRINPRTANEFEFFLMDGLDWANIIAITEDQQMLIVRQYRHGIEDFTLEIPGGCVEPHEQDPKLSACRELLEETGYQSTEVKHLGSYMANPAMQSIRCHTYLSQGVKKVSEPKLDQGEDIQLILMPVEEVFAKVASGEIGHSIVMAALMLFKLHRT